MKLKVETLRASNLKEPNLNLAKGLAKGGLEKVLGLELLLVLELMWGLE